MVAEELSEELLDISQCRCERAQQGEWVLFGLVTHFHLGHNNHLIGGFGLDGLEGWVPAAYLDHGEVVELAPDALIRGHQPINQTDVFGCIG